MTSDRAVQVLPMFRTVDFKGVLLIQGEIHTV